MDPHADTYFNVVGPAILFQLELCGGGRGHGVIRPGECAEDAITVCADPYSASVFDCELKNPMMVGQ
jgi:hypothetical protein